MLDTDIGLAFPIALGLLFAICGVRQIAKAYRITSLDEWLGAVLPAVGAVVFGVFFAWSGYRLAPDTAATAIALHASGVPEAASAAL